MKYYCIRQHDITDCGAACLATVAKHYGLNLPISKIREISNTDKQGTNVYGLIKAAEKLGITAKGVKGDQNAFFSEFPLPAIAHIVSNKKILHYVVIYKITKKEVVVADPSKGIIKYAPEDFLKLWTGVLIILAPSVTFKKGNEKENTLLKFFSLLIPQKSLLVNIFLASLIITIFGILASFYFKFIIDDIIPNSLDKTLTTISIGIIGLYLFKTIMEFFRNHLMLHLSQKLDIPIAFGYYQHVLSLPMNFFESRNIGEIVSRFMDASKIRETISGATLTIMIDTIMAIVGGIILYLQSSTLFVISIGMLFLYSIVVFFYNRPIRKVNEIVMENNSKVTSCLVESLNGIETIKSFNGEEKIEYKAEKLFVKFLKSIFHSGFLSNSQQSITNAIAVIGETIILWVGTINVLNGNMSIGQLITFNALLVYFLTPIKNLINLQSTLQTAIVAANRLGEIFELSPEKDDTEENRIQNISLKQSITISDLNFRYGAHKLVLKDINMSINPGEKVALVGESGSGKTTLVKLIMRFYSWESGEIYFGNYNIKDININTIRDKIAYISQETFLFNGTIRENIMFGNENASLEEIIEACKLSKASEFIEKLPMRYDTVIDENGANFSGGQKQRIAIARALLKKPDILIMDEATSNLDSITEKAIEKTINNLPNNLTTIIIAHRLSTIMHCDKIYVLENGKIKEEGSHKALMSSGQYYYNLWKEQIPGYLEVHDK